jgi:DNA-binding transcriptional LysR family regulator
VKDWDDMRFFLAAARNGSSRAAARALGVNQSTMSRRLSQFEDEQGVRLFERLARGLELTGPGQELFRSAEEIEGRFAQVERKLLGHDTRLSGLIRVSLPDFMVSSLGPTLSEFGKRYPATRTEVVVDNGFANLSQREADVVIRLAVSPPENLVGRRIASLAAGVYGSEEYLRGCDDAADLSTLDWIRWGNAWRTIPPERWIDKHVPTGNVRAVVNTNLAIEELAAAGLGVGFLACYTAEKDPRLKRVGPTFDFGLAVWLLTHEDIRRTARIATFMKFVGDELASERRHIEGPRPKARRSGKK